MIHRRMPKVVQCQSPFRLFEEVDRHNLLEGDVIAHKDGFKVISQPNVSYDCRSLEIPRDVCALFEDPLHSYRVIARAFPLKIEIDINHPAVASYIGEFDKRWYSVEISTGHDYPGSWIDTRVRVWYGKDFCSPQCYMYTRSWWLMLEKLLEPKVEVTFSLKTPVIYEAFQPIRADLPQFCNFPDKSIWFTGNGTHMYKLVESVHNVTKKWQSERSLIGNDLLHVIFSPTCYELELSPQRTLEFKVSRHTNLASQYVHEIILDVCLCFHPICPAPYFLLWILNEWAITKHDYIRKRIHVIEKIYESIRKVCENKTNKRVKI